MVTRPDRDGDQQLRLLDDAWDNASQYWHDGSQGLTRGAVDGADPAGERDGLHHVRRGGAEYLVQRAKRDGRYEPFVTLDDLAFGTRHRLDFVTRLDVTVRTRRGHHAPRRKLEVHHDLPVLRTTGHLVFARKAVRVLRSPQHAVDEPLHGLRIAGRERRLAAGDVRVPRHCSRAFLGDLPVVPGLGDGKRPPPFGFAALVSRLSGLETSLRLRPLAALADGGTQETAQPARRDGREIIPVRREKRGPKGTGIEFRCPRNAHEPIEAQRPERQNAGQDLIERLHPLLHRSGLVVRRLLLRLTMLLLAEPFLLACSLPSLSRQPVVFTPLHGQALLQCREASAPSHVSPGLRAWFKLRQLRHDDNRGRGQRKARAPRTA